MAKQFLFFYRPRRRLHSLPLRPGSDPIGLHPTNVKGYSLNQTTGSFVLFLDDKCRITLPPDNYLATYSKKIVSPSSTGSASGLSSSGGASPESDPAATTWCSRLEWSPPNTLLRISTKALSVSEGKRSSS
nr:uncharacterized protein LOC109186882 [Ipomoea batatas]